ncbi:related to MSN5 protein (multicopy supressor) [Cephalotrichum gorgonifer]|uniref:Related to MSN5 protein (Multicopy supressor) n=1 Tax=Cephalotrichum gorgonifer TaxID=2041049 RepID=A0AAE8MVA0_9PEZI|nr:related to MSN5 protein (multicopy supressor) [Cephalotrichum gorgonifer]
MAAQPLNGAGNPPTAAATVGSGPDALSKIHQALEVVHSPFSNNDSRRDAQSFLEQVKSYAEAPLQGYTLASEKSQSPVVRHYALSLLEHCIRHKWASYAPDEAAALRGWVLELCQAVSKDDPIYLRNKTAQLWVDVAKRSWAAEWMDMDALLVQLWQIPDSPAHKELVMFVLETLSEEVFNGDDAAVVMREGALSKACVEIFTSADILTEVFPNRQAGPEVRFGPEGWLARISEFLDQCLSADLQNNEPVRSCAVKALSVLQTLMSWAIPKAVHAANCAPIMVRCLAASCISVQKAALDALHALYCRTSFTDSEFIDLVMPMYETDTVNLCRRLSEWSTVDAEDIDEEKYLFSKKFSEMLSCLGNYIDRKFSVLKPGADLLGFLHLLLLVVQNKSLVVSIPVLVTWTRLLNNRYIGPNAVQLELIGPLLEVCSSRLIRYENLPEDSEDPSYLFLMEDTDTQPERHAFLGNYRRYSTQLIEMIVQLKLSDALGHIFRQTDEVLEHLYDGQPGLNVVNYSKHSMPVLRVDAQFTVIEAALKGYVKWRSSPARAEEYNRAELEASLETWCNKLMAMTFEDPQIRKRVLQLLVAFSTTALDNNANLMLRVLEHILMTWPALQPENRAYNDSIKDLQAESMVELQRLAAKMPDHLLNVYSDIEAKVKEMMASGTLDDKRAVAYQSFLFIILHRATSLDLETKIRRLQQFVDPIRAQWESNELKESIASYSSFCQFLGLDKAQQYLASRGVHQIKDWGDCTLDAEGLALQADLEDRLKLLPLRTTKSFIAFSVERIEKSSSAFEASYALWGDSVGAILPHLLQFLSHAHASHNPENWAGLSPEMRPIVGRVLSDRFWQAGISEGSKDDFYARVVDKKGTLEGLGSTIRGSLRFVRETCYAIIYCLSRMDVKFYGFEGLPQPLAQALLADATSLSTHQQVNILNLVRYLVDDCPVEQREHFLPPLLSTAFQQMDRKINSEWESLATQQTVSAEGEALTEEMKAESILRQVTYTASLMIADFLDPTKKNPPLQMTSGQAPKKYPSLRKFCLMHTNIVEPLLVFCTHAIRMRDSRCCSIILRVFRSIVPEFQDRQPVSEGHGGATQEGSEGGSADQYMDTSPLPAEVIPMIREYIASDVLKACITSLHEPYFVDLQKDLAALIAAIIAYYSQLTSTGTNILLSLPGVTESGLQKFAPFMAKPGSHSRQQRALVLELLKDVKGVSISEMGRVSAGVGGARSSKRAGRSKMAQEFMKAPEPQRPGRGGGGDGTVKDEEFDGVSRLFEG